MPLSLQPLGHPVGVGDGEAVDDARCPASVGSVSASQASRSAWSGHVEHVQAQAVAAERSAHGCEVGAELA